MIFSEFNYKNNYFYLLILLVFSACSSELDFNQTDNFIAEPVFVSGLVNFTADAITLSNLPVNSAGEAQLNSGFEIGDVFGNQFYNENVIRQDLFFKVDNSVNRIFDLKIILTDVNSTPLYTIPMTVPAYIGSPNIVTKTEIFEDANLDIIKSTSFILVEMTMKSGAPLNSGIINLSSSGTIYFKVVKK